jgi:hypothetical protein
MNKNFMIGFTYEGSFYCANVHRFNQAPVEYHITILANKIKDGLPSRIILKDEGQGPQQISQEPVPAMLLDTIVEEIQKRQAG